jgi:hypothetical protein
MATVCEKDFTLEVVTPDDLMAYWTLDENVGGTGGNRVDEVQGVQLVPGGGGITWTGGGKILRGVSFPVGGGTGILIVTNEALLAYVDSGITFFGWVRISLTLAGSTVINLGYSFKNGAVFVATIDFSYDVDTNTFTGILTGPINTIQVDRIQNIEDSAYHFFVLWYDQTDRKLHLQIDNGVVTDSPTALTAPLGAFNNSQFAIEGDGDSDSRIDEMGIFNSVLNSTRRSNLYNSGNGVTWPAVDTI